MGRASKKEMELRTAEAADLISAGHATSSTTSFIAEKYGISRRAARRVTAAAFDLIVQDLEEVDLSRVQMTAKLITNLESGMQKALLHNQGTAVAACAKQLITLCGLAADSKYNNRSRSSYCSALAYLLVAL